MNIASILRTELNYYNQDLSRVRNILLETSDLFDDIEVATRISGVRWSGEAFDEEHDLKSVIGNPPCLLVFGQTQLTKSKLVNILFGQPIYPSIDLNDESSWRTVRFQYGRLQTVGLTLPDQYELVDNLVAYDRPWKTLPVDDIRIKEKEGDEFNAVLDVQLSNPLMKEGLQIMVPSSHDTVGFLDEFKSCIDGVVPICLYGTENMELSDQEIVNLTELQDNNINTPILFVNVSEPVCPDSQSTKTVPSLKRLGMFEQLARLGFLNMLPSGGTQVSGQVNGESISILLESDVVDDITRLPQKLCNFVSTCLRNQLISLTTMLHVVHKRSLNNFIMRAFDMQRDMLITPKRIEFARMKELELFDTLLKLALEKQEEIKQLVSDSIKSAKYSIIASVTNYDFIGVSITSDLQVSTARDLRICNGQIRELVVGKLNHLIAGRLVESINVLRESYIGTLTRCINSLEQQDRENVNMTTKESRGATSALRQILTAAYQVNVQINPSKTFLKSFIEKMKQLISSLPWHAHPRVDNAWKEKVTSDMLDGLNESKLAKSIGEQFRDRLKQSHEQFTQALKQLELHHTGRLEKAEDRRQKLRKIHAPKVAKLALESSSLRDLITFGMPLCGKEIGRGQYGVVYSCNEWGGFQPCAIKSVVPPDDKHMSDLALEFYYTKNVPEHDRLVALRGSVIDYAYGGGTTPAVLIIMERMQRDFYTAIKTGFDWMSRLQVSMDVVEGIRFLHSQGLVHRDIKLKNVLLTKDNRGKITDLGFCKPEAMMSGSIVGTPIHMAPELFSGTYDNSVDVYAFGILFWYVCAGHVKLPLNFEQCSSKDQLFTSVKKGMRPEKLDDFDPETWELMSQCWSSTPSKRPLTGNVALTLEALFKKYEDNPELIASKNLVLTDLRRHSNKRRTNKPDRHTPIA